MAMNYFLMFTSLVAKEPHPNGIAYDEETGHIFVTGKCSPKVYEIELMPPE